MIHKLYLFLLLMMVSLMSLAQPGGAQYHEVQAGETKYGISREYGITIERLEKFNPDIKAGLKVGMTLLIPPPAVDPNVSKTTPMQSDSGFVKHVVKAQETLYSLARSYGVTIKDIKDNNPQLVDGLKVGQTLKIPVKKQTGQSPQELALEYHLHQVKPQETAWSISRKYEITLDSLYILNPDAQEGLRIGQYLKLPKNRGEEDKPQDELNSDVKEDTNITADKPNQDIDTAGSYLLYKIKSGDTFYSLKQRYNVSQEELVALNPEVSSGLEMDKYIIIPRKEEKVGTGFLDKLFKQTEIVGPDKDPSELQKWTRDSLNKGGINIGDKPSAIEDTLKVNISRNYRIAVMLPFYVDMDSISSNGKINPQSVYALEFYNGLLMASDSLTKMGMNLSLEVYDTKNNIGKVRGDIPRIRRAQYDLVVGPLFKRNAEYVAEQLESDMVPVVSPLSANLELNRHPNLIKCVPGEQARIREVAHLINNGYSSCNIIFVDYVPRKGSGQLGEIMQIKARLTPLAMNQSIQTVSLVEDEDGQLSIEGLKKSIVDSSQNVIVVISEDKVFLSTVVGSLRSAGTNTTKVSIIAPSAIMDISTLDLNYLNALNVTMTEKSYINYEDSATIAFVNNYRDLYKGEPSYFAFQGYDVGMYFFKKLWKTGPFFLQAIGEGESMLSTKFRMAPTENGGYENQSLYVTGIRNFKLVKIDNKVLQAHHPCYDPSLIHNRPCTDDCPGFIGCDGKYYCNECQAASQGIGPGNTSWK